MCGDETMPNERHAERAPRTVSVSRAPLEDDKETLAEVKWLAEVARAGGTMGLDCTFSTGFPNAIMGRRLQTCRGSSDGDKNIKVTRD